MRAQSDTHGGPDGRCAQWLKRVCGRCSQRNPLADSTFYPIVAWVKPEEEIPWRRIPGRTFGKVFTKSLTFSNRCGNKSAGVCTPARAAICVTHGVEALLTRDRDFSLFPELKTRDPIAG